jgi:hypothetical protein
MFAPIDLNNYNENLIISPDIKFLKVRTHKYGQSYMYLPIDGDKRKISDIIKLAIDFYHSEVDYLYLITLPYDDIKKRASALYKKKCRLMWKDITGSCKLKEIVLDCNRENAIELILDYNLSDII